MTSADFGSPLRKYKLVFLGEQSGNRIMKDVFIYTVTYLINI